MRLSKAEEKAILAAYGEDDTEGPVMDEKYWQTLISTMTVQDSPVRMPRQKVLIHLKDSYNEAAGKALYLDGSSLITLRLKGTDGKALLAGAKELTISYEAKPDRTGNELGFCMRHRKQRSDLSE